MAKSIKNNFLNLEMIETIDVKHLSQEDIESKG